MIFKNLFNIKKKESEATPKNKVMQDRDIQQIAVAQKWKKILGRVLVYTFLSIMALIVLFPFYFMIISSLKTLEEYRLPVPTLFPKEIRVETYTSILKGEHESFKLFTLLRNTVYVGIVSTILSLFITVFSAFAFARLKFKGRNALFAALLGTMMIPGELFTITNYATVMAPNSWFKVVFNGLGNMYGLFGPDFKIPMVDSTYAALIVPFLVSIFYIYLLRQNFLQIPNELYLAAKVDGTSDFKYLCKVMIPLALPTIISITILKMMGAWNSYMWPNLVAHSDEYRLITNGLRNAFNDTSGNTDYPAQMAAVALVSLPLFLVFIFLRKYIMKGVSRSGIKG